MINRPTLLFLRAAVQASSPISSRTLYGSGPQQMRPRVVIQRANISMGSMLTRLFSSSNNTQRKNRIFTPARNASELESYILSSTSSKTPLITFWTASYCPTCKVVGPKLLNLIESGIGEATSSNPQVGQPNGVNYVEVEYDAPDMMTSDLGMRYMISALPTLMTFDRGEAVWESRVTDGKQLKDERFLKEWVLKEATRRGDGNGGGGAGFFGGLFGNTR